MPKYDENKEGKINEVRVSETTTRAQKKTEYETFCWFSKSVIPRLPFHIN